MHRLSRLICLGFLTVLVSGCSSSIDSTPATPPTTQPTATVTSTPTATPTSRALGQTAFICSAITGGTVKVFTDPATGLTFSYPAAWTESNCTRFTSADGTQTLLIGNVFFVTVTPRQGQTIRQWVSAQAQPNETITLTPLSVRHAVEAASVTVQLGQGATPNEPFVQTMAIVAGTSRFYNVTTLIAQMSMTDTMPGISNAQLIQQVVSTFDVP
ncbi:MAG: hypothetical protein ACXWQ5_07735 [Ktedonobacterales bacterium]